MKRFLVALLVLVPLALFAGGKKLYVYNWSEYMPESVIAQFEKETGIKIVYSTYDSNEAMYAKLKIVGSGYDLAFPSTYYVNKMRKEGLLLPIDKTKITNLKHIDPTLLDKDYDKGNQYSVPYMWGSTALVLNTKAYPKSMLQSYKDLMKPEFKGQILLTNDMREIFGMALLALGYSGNSTNPDEIKAAYEYLKKLTPNVRLFSSESQKDPFINGEVIAGLAWNGQINEAHQVLPEIEYIYPKEGAILWLDSMVIPKGSKNIDAAHQFINFICRPEIAKTITEEIGYASPNKTAIGMLDPKVRNNPIVYPDKSIIDRSEFQLSVGPAITIYEKYWQKLKAGL